MISPIEEYRNRKQLASEHQKLQVSRTIVAIIYSIKFFYILQNSAAQLHKICTDKSKTYFRSHRCNHPSNYITF